MSEFCAKMFEISELVSSITFLKFKFPVLPSFPCRRHRTSSSSESEGANAAAGGGEQEREDQENRPSTSSSSSCRHPRLPLARLPDSPQQELQQHDEGQASQEQKLQHEREGRRQRAERRRDQRPVQEGQAAEDPHGREGEANQEAAAAAAAAAAQHEISSDELLRAIEESAQGILAPFAAPLEAARGAASDLRKLSAAAEALECHAPQEEERRGLLLRLLGSGAARLDESADGGEEEEAEASTRKRRKEEGEGSGGASAEKRRRRAEERGKEEGIADPAVLSTAHETAGGNTTDVSTPIGSDGKKVGPVIDQNECVVFGYSLIFTPCFYKKKNCSF